MSTCGWIAWGCGDWSQVVWGCMAWWRAGTPKQR